MLWFIIWLQYHTLGGLICKSVPSLRPSSSINRDLFIAFGSIMFDLLVIRINELETLHY